MTFYKYLHPDRIDVLKNLSVRFTQPGDFNDPFEMKPHFGTWGDDNLSINTNEDWDELKGKMIANLQDKPLFKMFSAKYPEKLIQAIESKKSEIMGEYNLRAGIVRNVTPGRLGRTIQSHWDSHIGILCLTEKPDNLLMWAHYAQNHTGFVIGFDRDHPFFNQSKSADSPNAFVGLPLKVNYSQIRPSLAVTELDNFKIFLVKSLEWQYEQEWRMLLPLSKGQQMSAKSQGGYVLYLFEVPPKSISRVIIGCRMAKEDKMEIRELLSSNPQLSHVQLSEAELHPQEFKLVEKAVIYRPRLRFPRRSPLK